MSRIQIVYQVYNTSLSYFHSWFLQPIPPNWVFLVTVEHFFSNCRCQKLMFCSFPELNSNLYSIFFAILKSGIVYLSVDIDSPWYKSHPYDSTKVIWFKSVSAWNLHVTPPLFLLYSALAWGTLTVPNTQHTTQSLLRKRLKHQFLQTKFHTQSEHSSDNSAFLFYEND